MEKMEFVKYIHAGYPLLWVQTFEEARAISSLIEQTNGEYQYYQWDLIAGFKKIQTNETKECEDPLECLGLIQSCPESSIIFVKDFHRFLQDVGICRKIKNLIPLLKSNFRHIIFISPVINIPVELEKDITVIDFALPTIDELEILANKLAKDNNLELTIDKTTVDAAKGLTMSEAENAFARSLITSKTYDRTILESEKLQVVKKSGLMEIYKPVPTEDIGGLENLKNYIISRKRGFEDDRLPTPKGILLAGLPGSGKSLTAKATASILNMPLIRLDLGTLKGGLVGESEANMKKATTMIDAISPCVVWLDEIEKSLSGVASSGKTDGGTGANMFGQLLTWMQESTSQKYIVATCNDIDDLLSLSQGALIRRFDDIFFVDLPTMKERKEILSIMVKKYRAEDLDFSSINTEGWTGAEIEKFVINSLYDGVKESAENIRPIAIQNKVKIDKAREWATNNAIRANGKDEVKLVKRTLRINK